MASNSRGRTRSFEHDEREDGNAYASHQRRQRRISEDYHLDEDRESQGDPYNVSQQQQQQFDQRHYQYLADAAMDRQLAYDSMSTILEVDSEGSELSGGLSLEANKSISGNLGSPLEVRTSETPEVGRATSLRSSGSGGSRNPEVTRPVSPLEDKFGGTLSALAAQVERLRRSSEKQAPAASSFTAAEPGALSSSESQREEEGTNGSRLPSSRSSNHSSNDRLSPSSGSSGGTNSAASGTSSSSSGRRDLQAGTGRTSATSRRVSEKSDDPKRGSPQSSRSASSSTPTSQADDDSTTLTRRSNPPSRLAASGAPRGSMDSLMMITLSPIVSPVSGFPISTATKNKRPNLRDQEDSDVKVVEVSHKSTITAIDSMLMNKMVEKYFVDTKDKGTQSIKFDCEPPSGGNASVNQKVNTKSVAVGTEKFTRERFSLLPETKTRSTQTKANMDNDIGTSETRRFKLGNLEFGPLIRGKSVQNLESQNADETRKTKESGNSMEKQQTKDTATDPLESESTSSVDTSEQSFDPYNSSINTTKQRDSSLKKTATIVGRHGKTGRKSEVERTPVTISKRGPQETTTTRISDTDAKISRLESELDKLKEKQKLQDARESERASQKSQKSRVTKVSPTPSSPLPANQTSGFNHDSLESPQIEDSYHDTSDERSSLLSASSNLDETKEDSLDVKTNSKTQSRKEDEKKRSSSASPSQARSQSENQSQVVVVDKRKEVADGGEVIKKQVIETKSSNKNDLIPCMKTELRVIIEIQDSKSRHKSEVQSDAQLIDGKLSKKTQVNTSKMVAVSPRQVLDKLQLAGKQHSLAYKSNSNENGFTVQPNAITGSSSPAVVAAQLRRQVAESRSSLRSASSMSNLTNRSGTNDQARAQPNEESKGENDDLQLERWREVSNSTVFNEFETDINKKPKATKTKSSSSEGQEVEVDEQGKIVLSSQATINHFANNKSSIDLRSRATKQTEEISKDAKTGKMVKSGRVNERILVQSEAGFNENEGSPEVIPLSVPTIAVTEEMSKHQIGQAPGGDRLLPEPQPQKSSGGLIKRLREQEEIAREKLGRKSPLIRPRELMANGFGSPTYQSSSSNNRLSSDQQNHQQPEQRRLATPVSARSTPNLSEPNLRLYSGNRIQQQQHRQQEQQQPRGKIEIEEETEDRRQVSRNGRLVYDDRLRERRYETQQVPTTGGGSNNVGTDPKCHRQSASTNQIDRSSPNLNGILRNSNQRVNQSQTQNTTSLLKPIASPSPIANMMPTDQTSNLSASDPETMDSGFAQSGAGSSNILNTTNSNMRANLRSSLSQHQYQSAPSSPRARMSSSSDTSNRKSRLASPSSQNLAVLEDTEGDNSLNFVDDDVDELIDQLGGSRMLSPPPMVTSQTSSQSRRSTQRLPVFTPRSNTMTSTQQSTTTTRDLQTSRLISPPPAFCSSEPAGLNRFGVEREGQPDTYNLKGPIRSGEIVARGESETRAAPLATTDVDKDTEITTVLTRFRVLPTALAVPTQNSVATEPTTITTTTQKSQRRTRTQFEQNLVAPVPKEDPSVNSGNPRNRPKRPPNPWTSMANQLGERLCRFRAQVTFESDTDSASAAGDRQSVSSGAGGGAGGGTSSPLTKGSSGKQLQRSPTNQRERKELLSETKYTLSDLPLNVAPSLLQEPPKLFVAPGEVQVGSSSKHFTSQHSATTASSSQVSGQQHQAPNWDYSLRVNRMRGSKVDSKVK